MADPATTLNQVWAAKTHGHQIAWSTPGFDWACTTHRGTLDDDGIASLQQQLHPGEPVVGAPSSYLAVRMGPDSKLGNVGNLVLVELAAVGGGWLDQKDGGGSMGGHQMDGWNSLDGGVFTNGGL